MSTVRLWFKDGTYMDVDQNRAWEYESQPDYDRTEDLNEVVDDVDEN